MRVHDLPELATLDALLICDPVNGKLWWKARPVTHRAVAAWNARCAGTEAGNVGSDGYVRVWVCGRSYRRSAIIWAMYHQTRKLPPLIDHCDGVVTEDRIGNLRASTKVDNGKNAFRNARNTTGVPNVSWQPERQKFAVRFARTFVGRYDTIEEAAAARAEAAARLGYSERHGEVRDGR